MNEGSPVGAAADTALFLRDSGEMGARIAAFDWSRTSLGPIAGWPPCLTGSVGMIIRSPVSMVLAWGPDGILLYNEGYAAVGGRRHPAMLGMSVLEAWPEAAAFNSHVLQTVRAGGSLKFENQRLTLYRTGHAEDAWFDLGYSPVLDESGRPAGVLAVVIETTARNLSDERLRIAQEAGKVGTFEWYPKTRRMVVSDVYRRIYGLTPDEEVTDDKLLALLPPEDRVVSGQERYGKPGNPLAYAEYRVRRPDGPTRWIARRGEILPGGPDTQERYLGVAWDITEKKLAELQAAFLSALGDRLRDLRDPNAAIATATEMLGRHLGAGRVGFGEVDAAGGIATVLHDWTDGSLPGLPGRHVVSAFGEVCVAAFRRGETVQIDDVPAFAAASDALVARTLTAIGAGASLTVPLIRDGRFAALLYAHDKAPRAWSEPDCEVVQAVAARIWDAVQRARAEQRLRDSEENFRLLAQAIPNQAWVANASGTVIWVNEQAVAYTGIPLENVRDDDWSRLVHDEDRTHAYGAWAAALKAGAPLDVQYRLRRHDGVFRWHLVRALPIRGAGGRVTRWIGTNTDIEEQRRTLAELVRLNGTLEERVEARTRELRQAEEALRQSQKMEAIGQLTGGIAHDFNNLLTGIIGSLELVKRRLDRIVPADDARLADIGRFMDAATGSALRAASLTHRLLAFARRQPLDTRPVDIAALMHGLAELLQRTLGAQLTLRIEVAEPCGFAMTDPNQLESALLNLAINARDAMSAGGVLTLSAGPATPEMSAGRPAQGGYVAVTVADTGSGMAPEVLEKAFEPFFTTKPLGHGTGLGLSMVYGFAQQTGGDVQIASRPGEGTSVTLLLPRAAAGATMPDAAAPVAARGEGLTVLVVEDVAAVRMLMVQVLRDLGYRAIEAEDAAAALPVLSSTQHIDLLVTDVGLPGLNGREVADYARARRPGLKVLFVTGYAEDTALRNGVLGAGMALLPKPFAVEQLAAKVGEMMAADGAVG